MDRRTKYGIHWHERQLREKLEAKIKVTSSPGKRHRLVQRYRKSKARELAAVLAES